jgi:hypothetical protein
MTWHRVLGAIPVEDTHEASKVPLGRCTGRYSVRLSEAGACRGWFCLLRELAAGNSKADYFSGLPLTLALLAASCGARPDVSQGSIIPHWTKGRGVYPREARGRVSCCSGRPADCRAAFP